MPILNKYDWTLEVSSLLTLTTDWAQDKSSSKKSFYKITEIKQRIMNAVLNTRFPEFKIKDGFLGMT